MQRGDIADLFYSLQRPPFYTKLALLSRYLLFSGCTYLSINPNANVWRSKVSEKLLLVVEIINFPVLAFRGSPSLFHAVWGVAIGLIFLILASGYFAFLKTKKSQTIPPIVIRILRLLLGFAGAMPIPIFVVLLGFADCDYGSFNDFPGANIRLDFVCASTTGSTIGLVASALFAAVFAGIASLQAFIQPMDPHTNSILQRAHSRCEMFTIFANLGLWLLLILIRHYIVFFGFVKLIVQVLVFVSWVFLQPYHSKFVQTFVSSLSAVPAWTALCFFILTLDIDNDKTQQAIIVVMLAGCIPVMVFCGTMSTYWRKLVLWKTSMMMSRVHDTTTGFEEAIMMYEPYGSIGIFDAIKAMLVEVYARSVLGEDDAGAAAAVSILRRGIILFPQSVYLRIQHAGYLLRTNCGADAINATFSACDQLRMNIEEELTLILLRREAAIKFRGSGGSAEGFKGDGNMEAFDELELKQRLADVKMIHLQCQQLIAQVWTHLHRDSKEQLPKAMKQDRKKKILNVDGAKGTSNLKRNTATASAGASSSHHHHHGKGESKAAGGGGGAKNASSSSSNHLHHRHPFGVNNNSDNEIDFNETAASLQRRQQQQQQQRSEFTDDKSPRPLGTLSAILQNQQNQAKALTYASFSSVMSTLEQLRLEESKADAAFSFLLTRGGDSPEMLQEFAAYVRNVKLDEAGAKALEARRDAAIVEKEAAVKKEMLAAAAAAARLQKKMEEELREKKLQLPQQDRTSSFAMGTRDRLLRTGLLLPTIPFESNNLRLDASKKASERSIVVAAGVGMATGDSAQGHGLVKGSFRSVLTSIESGSEEPTTSSPLRRKSSRMITMEEHEMDMKSDYESAQSGNDENQVHDFSYASDADENAAKVLDEDEVSNGLPGDMLRRPIEENVIAREKTEMAAQVAVQMTMMRRKLSILTALMLCCAGGLIWAYVSLAGAATLATSDVDFSGFRRYAAVNAAFGSRRMYVAAAQGDMTSYASAAYQMSSYAAYFAGEHMTLAHTRKLISSRLRSYYTEPSVSVRIAQDTNGTITTILLSPAEAIERVFASTAALAKVSASEILRFNKKNPSSNPDLFYAMDNAVAIFRAMDSVTLLTVVEADTLVAMCITVMACVSAGAAFFEIVIIFGVLRPSVDRMFLLVGTSISKLGTITHRDRAEMVSRFRAVQKQAETAAMNEPEQQLQVIMNADTDIGSASNLSNSNSRSASPSRLRRSPSPIGVRFDSGEKDRLGEILVTVSPRKVGRVSIASEKTEKGATKSNVSFSNNKNDYSSGDDGEEDEKIVMDLSSVPRISPRVTQERQGRGFERDRESKTKKKESRSLKDDNSNNNNNNNNSILRNNNNNTASFGNGLDVLGWNNDLNSSNGAGFLRANKNEDGNDNDGGNPNNSTANNSNKTSTTHRFGNVFMTKKSFRQKLWLQVWYYLCLALVLASVAVMFSLSYQATDSLRSMARLMNNIARRRDLTWALTWQTFELMLCTTPLGLCGGVMRTTSTAAQIQCYLKEYTTAMQQTHNGDLLGRAGWERGYLDMGNTEATWNTPCSVFTEQEDLFEIGKDLGEGAVRSDPRMNQFMYERGHCLAVLSELPASSAIFNDNRTASMRGLLIPSACTLFNKNDPMMMLGLNRLTDEMLKQYRMIAKTNNFLLQAAAFATIQKYTMSSTEFLLGNIKGTILMQATLLDVADSHTRIVAGAFSVLVIVCLFQRLWLRARVEQSVENTVAISMIVHRMMKVVQEHRKMTGADGAGVNSLPGGASVRKQAWI